MIGTHKGYRDKYENIYCWYTSKQDDGKYHAFIRNKRSGKKRTRIFGKKKTAMRWCLTNCRKAIEIQNKAITETKRKKSVKEAKKPQLTTRQIAFKKAENKIKHYRKLQDKCNRKIKSLVTRQKTYQKKINYHQKRCNSLKSSLVWKKLTGN